MRCTCLLIQHYAAAAAVAKSLQSCPTLCDPRDSSPPGSPVPRILQARTLKWVAISFSNAWKWKVKVKSLNHVCLFRDPMDCSLPGSSFHGIFQARVLEWGATAFSGCYCSDHIRFHNSQVGKYLPLFFLELIVSKIGIISEIFGRIYQQGYLVLEISLWGGLKLTVQFL